MDADWDCQLDRNVQVDQLAERLRLSAEEQRFFDQSSPKALPMAITPYYLALCDPENSSDPIRRQCVPSVKELDIKPYELEDPLGEEPYAVTPRLIHRYPDRVLLLVTGRCAVNCRHCFRRRAAARRTPPINREELDRAIGYCRNHPEVGEVILSGGDPLTLEDNQILEIIESFRLLRPDMVIRLHSRMPVVLPQRITPELSTLLAASTPLWLVTHFNHPREITPDSSRALNQLTGAGVPVLNQSVLLRGINDRLEILSELYRSLVRCRVKPYYLFQGDLAQGTAHFRVPLSAGLQLAREMAGLSGLLRPVYALDLPGGGKIRLLETQIRWTSSWAILENAQKEQYRYPVEGE